MKSLSHCLCLAGLATLGLASSGAVGRADTNKLELPPGFNLWQPSLNLRSGFGYKDNVTLSSFAPQASSFESVSGEAMLMRLPWDNWQINLFAVGTDTRYLNHAAGVEAEDHAAASAQFTWFPQDDWRTITTVEYAYMDQMMDVSATYGATERQQVLGQGLTVKQGARADVGPWFADATFAGSRYYYRAPLDHYWQFGPTLTAGRYYGRSSEVSLTYGVLPLRYDTREQVASDGALLTNTSLRFVAHNVDLTWQQHWDQARRWRTTVRLNGERTTDNGSGYFDSWQYRFTTQLRFRPPGWELSARASVAYYDFNRQPLSPSDPRTRHRSAVLVGLRAEKILSRHWKLFAAYDYERSLSNLDLEQYAAQTCSGGLEYEF